MTHTTYLSTYRTDGYSPRLYLSVYVPVVACSGTLTATPSTPTTSLAVSYVTGSESDVHEGFRLAFYTSGGDLKGYGRVRFSGANSSTTLQVRELSNGSTSLVSGDTFRVLREVPMDTKLVAATVAFEPDGIGYGTEGSEPPPLVCSGGNSVGWVDAGQTYRTVRTDGSHTSLVNPDSVTTPTHFWQLPSGGAFAGGSINSDASPVLQLNVGSWLVYHASTDVDTSRGAWQWTHHVVHDSTHLPYEVVLTDYSGDHELGVNWTVEVMGDSVTDADIPELAICYLWTQDTFIAAGEVDMHRSEVTGRSHMIGMGYARRVHVQMSGEDGVEHVSFEIQSPLARLSEIAGYSKVMLQSTSPDEWSKVKTLGFKRGISQLWMFYTTGTESGSDLVFNASFSDARYPAHYLQRSDPIGQIRELIDARQGRLVQREYGARFEVQYHPSLVALADRP